MAFKLIKNIYQDDNFSISEGGGINVYGTASMNEISDKISELFPDRVKIDENGNMIINLNGL